MLFGDEHVRRYRETDGEVGHEWQPGVNTLLLTTTGRRSGERRTTPLIYIRDGDDYVVVASKGGADAHPDWYFNLSDDPSVQVQVLDAKFTSTARTADPADKDALWPSLVDVWPDYDNYAESTDRDIPVVRLAPVDT